MEGKETKCGDKNPVNKKINLPFNIFFFTTLVFFHMSLTNCAVCFRVWCSIWSEFYPNEVNTKSVGLMSQIKVFWDPIKAPLV